MGEEMERMAYPPAMMSQENDRSLLAEATNPAKIIEELSHRLRGEVFFIIGNEGKWVLPNGSKPKCNEQGLNELLNEIFTRVNQNTIFSNLNKQEVSNMIISFGDSLMILLAEKMDEWEISENDLDSVFNMCVDIVYLALKRGFEQGERRFLSKVASFPESVVHTMQPKKRGILDGILNRDNA